MGDDRDIILAALRSDLSCHKDITVYIDVTIKGGYVAAIGWFYKSGGGYYTLASSSVRKLKTFRQLISSREALSLLDVAQSTLV